jgi:hypothetical protein
VLGHGGDPGAGDGGEGARGAAACCARRRRLGTSASCAGMEKIAQSRESGGSDSDGEKIVR